MAANTRCTGWPEKSGDFAEDTGLVRVGHGYFADDTVESLSPEWHSLSRRDYDRETVLAANSRCRLIDVNADCTTPPERELPQLRPEPASHIENPRVDREALELEVTECVLMPVRRL